MIITLIFLKQFQRSNCTFSLGSTFLWYIQTLLGLQDTIKIIHLFVFQVTIKLTRLESTVNVHLVPSHWFWGRNIVQNLASHYAYKLVVVIYTRYMFQIRIYINIKNMMDVRQSSYLSVSDCSMATVQQQCIIKYDNFLL